MSDGIKELSLAGLWYCACGDAGVRESCSVRGSCNVCAQTWAELENCLQPTNKLNLLSLSPYPYLHSHKKQGGGDKSVERFL